MPPWTSSAVSQPRTPAQKRASTARVVRIDGERDEVSSHEESDARTPGDSGATQLSRPAAATLDMRDLRPWTPARERH